ncbi:MAG: hypothetical protein AMXMBFR84_43910 [Candidatus Hydrogenedentota bacterium]
MLKRILKIALGVVVVLVIAFVTLIGPWPTYGPSDVQASKRFKSMVTSLEQQAAKSQISSTPGRLRAGWGKGSIIPRVGIPLAGYGDRGGKPSIGIADELFAKAIVMTDGHDKIALVGSDMLIVPENVADAVRAAVAEQTDLDPRNLLFNASHSHSGPGGFGPGLMASMFMGKYDPAIPEAITKGFVEAITSANGDLSEAKIASGRLDAPDYIRNRSREAAVDPGLNYMIVERDDGKRCIVSRYSAHSTVLGGSNMKFSGDFPGYLQRALEREPDTFAVYLAGAVGSMGPKAPEGPDGFARAEAMGNALATRIKEACAGAAFETHVDIASTSAQFKTPPFQLRINPSWRVSPFLLGLAGVDNDAWIHGLRIGNQFFYGTPCDFSGELSVEMEAWAKEQGLALWVLSFNGDYIGYVSPARYYTTSKPSGDDSYEMYVMSWFGPDQEAWFAEGLHQLVNLLNGPEAPLEQPAA